MGLLLPKSAICMVMPLMVTDLMSSKPSGSDSMKVPAATEVPPPEPVLNADSLTTSFAPSGSPEFVTIPGGSFWPLMLIVTFAKLPGFTPSLTW